MEFTIHAHDRALERTRTHFKDIDGILSGNAFVPLGFANDCEFLLFFSPRDDTCKVAVVAENRRVLVSIWRTSYRLPESVTAPTAYHKRLAKHKYLVLTKPGLANEEFVAISAEVHADGRCVYTERIEGVVGPAELAYSSIVIAALLPRLKSCAHVVESVRSKLGTSNRRIQYILSEVQQPERSSCFRLTLSHRTLMRYLGTA